MKKLLMLFMGFLMIACGPVMAGFEGLNNSASLKIFNRINCGSGIECTRTGNGIFNVEANGAPVGNIIGDGSDVIRGYLNATIEATATTIAPSQCGATFINAGAVQMELPEASTVIGCRLTFIVANASNFDINPDDADQILVETDVAGDAIRNATLGNSITIEAISATQWAPVAVEGTWADID